MLDVGGIDDRFAAAEVPSNELDGEAASHHNKGGFGVAPDVVFSGGSDITLAAGRAPHDYAAADMRGDFRLFLESEGDVRERAQRDNDKTGVGFDSADYCFRSVLFPGWAARRR